VGQRVTDVGGAHLQCAHPGRQRRLVARR